MAASEQAAGSRQPDPTDPGEPAAPEGWIGPNLGVDVTWTDATESAGLVEPLLGIRGHAVSAADVNADGWTDLFVGTFADRDPDSYVVRGGTGPAPDVLLLGGPAGFRADDTFPGRLGRTAGAAFADLDNDGDPDLIVSRNVREGDRRDAPSEILRNDNGTFVSASVLDETRGGRAVAAFDADKDGHLEIILVEDRWSGGSTALFTSDGPLEFHEATEAFGLPPDVHGLGAGIVDLNGDGWDDIVIGGSNRVFRNDAGRFVETEVSDLQFETYGDEDDVAHIAAGDIDGDGDQDLVIGQHYNSTLDQGRSVPVRVFLNESTNAEIRLRDVTDEMGLTGLPTKAPQVLMADVSGDGLLDVVTTASADDGSTPATFTSDREASQTSFRPPSGLGNSQYWIDAVLLDANHDGKTDIFLVEWEPSIGSKLLLGN